MTTPVALTIAGSDSSGGAGIQADLKTFQAFGVFGTSAITAITAQNTHGVRAVHAVPGPIVREQIDAVAADFAIGATKSGMLATRALVELVAEAIRDHALQNYVLDPVMVATSGDRLLEDDAVHAILTHLLPLSTLVTPNLDEASILTGRDVTDVAGMREAAQHLVERGARAALVKGGHLAGPLVVDVLFDGNRFREFEREKLQSTSTHGTGCTLSSAIAAGLAMGDALDAAVESALAFVHDAIRTAPDLGGGHGPLNFLVQPAPARPTNPAD
jgi:hydroxymethylpyrimidine kinase/phosphomethylpyrimidine kinase